jgi:hypothetical protein
LPQKTAQRTQKFRYINFKIIIFYHFANFELAYFFLVSRRFSNMDE